MMRKILLASIALSLVSCGTPDPSVAKVEGQDGKTLSSSSASPRYRAAGTVLEEKGSGAVLCLGSVDESLPPQCSGISIEDWDWKAVPDEESAGGTKWGSYEVTGSYDGETFTLATVRPAQADSTAPEDPIESACPTPSGGWSVPDPKRMAEPDVNFAISAARAQPDHAGAWIVYIEELSEERVEPGNNILNLAFTGNVEAHEAEIRDLWGGPLCVVAFEHTLRELRRIQNEIQEIGESEFDLEVLSTGTNKYGNVVEISVVVIYPATQAEIDARYGSGVVEVTPQLVPLP